jgi:hypothetical protein
MFGPQKDKPNQCNARMFLGDDYGDNDATFRCQLPVGHEGPHQEKFERKQMAPTDIWPNPPKSCGKAVISWEFDERFDCPYHGVQNTSECRVCDDARRNYEHENACEKCFGYGDISGETLCVRCAGTGYDPEKCPEKKE